MADQTDDFEGSSEFDTLPTHNSNWVENQGTWFISGDGATYGNTAGSNLASWSGFTFAADQFSEIVVKAVADFVYTGAAVRLATNGSANGYYFRGSGIGGSLGGEVVNGTATDESGTGANVVATDVIFLSISGDDLTPKINNVEVTAITPWNSTAHSSGRAGLSHNGNDNGSRADSWRANDLAAGSSIPVIMNQYKKLRG